MKECTIPALKHMTTDLPPMGMNLLLIGPSNVTQKLAKALVQVDLSYPISPPMKKTSTDNPAIEVLRKHYGTSSSPSSSVSPKRCIHTIESLTLKDKTRKDWGSLKMDHIVMINSPPSSSHHEDNDEGTSGIMTKADFETVRKILVVNDDNHYMQRITIIEAMVSFQPAHDDFERQHLMTKYRTSHDSLGLTTFLLYLDDPQSHATVARMILQRARLGSRQQQTLIPVDPHALV